MKVLLINGSPHQSGCTYTALSEVAGVLNQEGIRTEILQLGSKPMQGWHRLRAPARIRDAVRLTIWSTWRWRRWSTPTG